MPGPPYGAQRRSEAASGSNKTLDDLEDDEGCLSSPSAAAGPPSPVTGPSSRRRWPRILSVIESTPTNLDARQKALDIQAGNVEAEGKEAIGSSIQSQEAMEEEEPEESAVSSAYLISYFIAGGAAGAASRTVVSPLERLKSEFSAGKRAAEL